MPPKTRRQVAASRNYRKRKDRDETGARESTNDEARVGGETTGGEARVGGETTGGEARVGGESTGDEARPRVGGETTGDEARVGGKTTSDEERVRCETTSDKARVGSESTSNVRGEKSTSNDYDEQDLAVKHPRLEDISALAAEPLQEWLDNLPRDDLRHVALLLYTNLPRKFGLQKTDTAATVSEFLQRSGRTIRCWIDDFVRNDGEFSDTQQGHYVRNNTLMSNEELCEKARVYVRANAAPRGRPNLTSSAFCQWVNNDLLPNSVLEPGYPRRVSVETARKWLHELGFELAKGVFIDGHDRSDVVESRVKFLRTMD